MRVLVTGGGGFMGSHLVRSQLAKGRQVRALDVETSRLADLDENESLEAIQGDITDEAVQARALDGVDTVFHLASAHLQVGIPEEIFWRVNVHNQRGFLERARDAGVQRFVHTSSVGVYGQMSGEVLDEDSPCAPDILYERTKHAGEQEVRRFFEETGFPIVILRPAWVYGPGCNRTEKLFRSIRKGRFLMVGDGRSRRYTIYIDDCSEGFELAATRDNVVGETILLTDHEPVTINELTTTIAEILGVKKPKVRVPLWLMYAACLGAEGIFKILGRQPPVSRRSLRFFTNDMALNTNKTRNVLGYNPRRTLREGLELTHRWLVDHQKL